MKIAIILTILLLISSLGIFYYTCIYSKSSKVEYSGPVRPCDDEEFFRKTGITLVKEDCVWDENLKT